VALLRAVSGWRDTDALTRALVIHELARFAADLQYCLNQESEGRERTLHELHHLADVLQARDLERQATEPPDRSPGQAPPTAEEEGGKA
jgi:hypothetical protein